MSKPLIQWSRIPPAIRFPTRRASAAVAAALAIAVPASIEREANAATYSGSVVTKGKGFDRCSLPTVTEMTAWKNGGYNWIGVYLGGPLASCGGAGATGFNNALTVGLGVAPIWVDKQSACWSKATSTNSISNTTTTAATQGTTAGTNAVNAAKAAGLTSAVPIYLDLEGHSGSTACRNAAKAFVNAFNAKVKALGFKPGLYGSAGSSYISDFSTIANPPDQIFAARVNGTMSVYDLAPYIASTKWTASQRLRQYQIDTTQTVGGKTLRVDLNCADGRVAPSTARVATVAACYSK